MTISAYLGVVGLVDVGYRFYTSAEAAVAARVTTGITDSGSGWYSASVTLPTTSASVRWDSTGTAEANAREYWTDPWGLPVPNGYPSGTAGQILGDNLNATISSRSTPAQVQTELATYGALKPTTAGRTLDVTTTGEAGIDWANIGSPTTAQNLSATNIDTDQVVASVTAPVTLTSAYDPAKTAATQTSVDTISGYVDTELASVKATTDKLDTALVVDGATYQFTANALELGPVGGGGGGGGDASQATLLAVKAKTDLLPTDPADASIIADSFTTVNSKLDQIDDYIDLEVSAILNKTNNLPSDPASASTIATSFANTNAKIDQVDSRLDSEIPAILGKVNALPSDPASQSSVNSSFTTLNTKVDTIAGYVDLEVGEIKTVTDKLGTTLEPDGGVHRFTANSLEQAPGGGPVLLSIKERTDHLPDDPADQSNIDASFATVNTKLDTINGAVDSEIPAILGKVNNLPGDPASNSNINNNFAVTNGKIDVIDDYLDTELAAVKAKTDQLIFSVPNRVDANSTVSLSLGDLNSIADCILKRDFSLVTGEAARSLLNAARFLRNKFSVNGTTLTVYRENNVDVAWSSTVGTDVAAEPIVSSSP